MVADICKATRATFTRDTHAFAKKHLDTRGWKSFRVLVSALLKTVVMLLLSNYKLEAIPRVIENYEDEQ